ncbi:DUF3231 family protein, partial [Neobacillus drentensis]|uniref:DUF3231 family protein n=1 Tax=Neobacillus drentensis TaxID=220684 RepID=UPI0030016A91
MQTNDPITPINLNPINLCPSAKLTAPEMGKLWATYVGNSMSNQILKYYLQHCEDDLIRTLLENAYNLTVDFMKKIEEILKKDHFPIPIGFTDEDVNLGAPRLFEDEFYVHYLKYLAKAGLSIYSVAIPVVLRKDIRDFFIYCNSCTITLLSQINDILMVRGYIIKPPVLPVPENIDFIK